MKTGTIVLISTNSKRGKIIQNFQKKADEESGKWNHSGLIWKSKYETYVVEEAEIEGRKTKAAAVITPLSHYLNEKYELKFLIPIVPVDEAEFEKILLKYVGVPYDYFNLLHDQVLRTWHNIWVGRGYKKGWKRMLCHEFSQFIWEEYAGIFPEYYKGDVSQIYHSKNFTS